MRIKEKEEILAAEIVEDFKKRQAARRPLELQWRLNADFFQGRQYAEITPLGDVREYGKAFYWQEREVYNHIASIVETRLSKLARTKIGVTVRPASDDDTDVNSAKLATQVVKALCEENNLPELLNTACMWSEVTGTCFFKVEWDADKGRAVGKDRHGKTVREGDVIVSVVPPYEIFPDNLCAASFEECRSVIRAKAVPVAEAQELWGVLPAPQRLGVFSLEETGAVREGAGEAAEDCCLVLERYERPSREMPEGRLRVVVGDRLVFDGPLPYVNAPDGARGYPFAKIHCIERAGCFFGTSIVERMIPLQRAYNAVKNRKHEFLNRLATGVLAVEDGSVDLDNLEEEGLAPGKILVYRQGSAAPKMMDGGQLPYDFRQEEERLISEFITISGVSELSKYSQTYSSMSGRAIALLVEQDDTRLSIASSSLRMCVRRICQQILRLYRQFATHKRLKKIAGEDGAVRLASFDAGDLQSEDIVFDSDNDLSDTLASRRNMVLELLKMGILHEENGGLSNRNKVKALEMLGLGNWEGARDVEESHRGKALRENLAVRAGAIEVGEFDDHELHLAEHIKAINAEDAPESGAYRRLAAHIRAHRAGALAAQAEELQ